MNPVAMQPIGGAGQGMDAGENGPPGGNAEAENPAGGRKIVKTYCINAYDDGTYSADAEKPEADETAEGEDASAAPAPAPAEGGENEADEGEQSLGDNLSLPDAMIAIVKAEKSRKAGGGGDDQGNMDEGFQAQGGGQVHG